MTDTPRRLPRRWSLVCDGEHIYSTDDAADAASWVAADPEQHEARERSTDPEAWVLGAHLRAIARLLSQSGDITPYGAELIRRVVAEHLPDVVWDDDAGRD